MNPIEIFKYIYLFLFFLALIRTLIFTCMKITEYIMPVIMKRKSISVSINETHTYLKEIFPRVIVLSIFGVLASIGIFAIIGDNTVIEVSKHLIAKLNSKII